MPWHDSLTVWLPKEMYGSVEPFADQRYIWSPMPFDESLPVEQTSFIRMGGAATDSSSRGEGGGFNRLTEGITPPDLPTVDVSAGSMESRGPDDDSDEELFFKREKGHLDPGRRRHWRMQPAQRDKFAGSGKNRGCRRRGRGFAVHLALNLDLEVTLEARVCGGLELSAL
ncbi:hypothetical protein CCHL11_01778 [Colletotrichum chlorophyti]|uniref:Uncharacterized protein n=1 Tax=Colletotrichum chlorophyti TaxID=708187 RepID=A0A1Q8RVU8_9PEZI|nr:hypothetical protein CCHL11_01778 [Colletotrichum chlorophyti]